MNFKSASTLLLALVWMGLSACSTTYKQRQAERDRVSQNSGLYCEFVNGDDHNDIDVEMNLQMAKKCDTSKPVSFTNYKNASDIFGVIYCCTPIKKSAATGTSSQPGGKGSAPNTQTPNAKDKKASDEIGVD